jgi:hypothetical protein
MTAAAAVIVCAIELLGRKPSSMPPIELVSQRPADVSANADAFVREGQEKIFVLTASDAYSSARCENRRSLIKLASIIAHEEWHVRNGMDERKAYEAQLLTLMRLGATPDSQVYRGVMRAMQTVLAKPPVSARPEGVLASRQD